MGVSGRQALSETLAKVRTRIRQLHERGDRVGEEDTKAILIEPVLAALGWQLDELDEVRREYRFKSQDSPVDYALLVFGQPRLFVEAKALDATLDRRCASQVMGYASVVGVGWCLLTNGDEYRLYNSHALVDVEEKLFRTVRLSDAEQEAHCLETLELFAKEHMGETELDALWKSQFVDRHVKAALEELFSGEDPGLGRFIHRKAPELSLSEVRESLRRANIHVHFPEVPLPSAAPEPAMAAPGAPATRKSPRKVSADLADLIGAGLIRPPLQLEKTYKGIRLKATIEQDGQVHWEEKGYDSLSTAGGMARKSVIGAPEGRHYPQTNGWTFWQFRDPESGQLRLADELRQQYVQGQV